jgi:Leucine-rich repeat (LRR) protein
MAVKWLDQEARRTFRVGNTEATSDIAERFALLALQFSALKNLDPIVAKKESPQAASALVKGKNETTEDVSTTTLNSSVFESSTFFGGVQRANVPTEMFNSEFLVHQCEWSGIVCNDDNHVTHVRWEHRDYTGTIPSEIRILTTLTHLDLSNNYMEGPIPTELYHLTDLEKLYLFNNFLTGTISTLIGELDKITHFHVSHNQLTGPIPKELKSDGGSKDGIRPLSKNTVV